MVKKDRSRRSFWGRFFHFLWLKPVRWILFAGIIAALIYWQRFNIVTLTNNIALSIWNTLGWGLVLVPAALITILIVIWRQQLSSLLPKIRLILRVLGSFAIVIAVWGALAFWSMGGSVGRSIAGESFFTGLLRITGWSLLGFFLIAPVLSFRLIKGFFPWLRDKLRREPKIEPYFEPEPQPRPEYVMPPEKRLPPQHGKSGGGIFGSLRKTTPAYEPASRTFPSPAPLLTVPQTQVDPPAKTEASPLSDIKTNKPSSDGGSAEDLKQVAQEVWKKYGESPTVPMIDGWRLPPIEILDRVAEVEFSQADNAKRAKLIEDALTSYGVEAKVVQINPGPTVTQFGLEPGWDRKTREVKERDKDGNIRVRVEEVSKTRVKVERITSLANDLALTLAAPSIRFEAPVPGKSVVGVEVPNISSSTVSMRSVIETSSFQKLKAKTKMALALGKGAGGEAVAGDLTKMPHLLIAGATGSGKTVCLNTIVCSLLLHNIPSEVQFIMIDPKRVELTPFNSIPHLAAPVVVDTDKALFMLQWLNEEMDRRYKKLAADGTRNIDGFNKKREGPDRMSYLVLIIDELADLMMTSSDNVEHNLCRLAQLARAAGIHLVVATQRPSVDVVTGLIKANFPTRISFAVTSQVDSRTILDSVGAEKLLGKGDMLYAPTEADKPKRLQGCFVSDPEVERLVYFWNSQQNETKPQLNIDELVNSQNQNNMKDSLLDNARQLARDHKQISASFLQRHLRIGYPRAARLMEQLEDEGIEDGEEDI